MGIFGRQVLREMRRTSQEVRELKFSWALWNLCGKCRTSQEVRELKFKSLLKNL